MINIQSLQHIKNSSYFNMSKIYTESGLSISTMSSRFHLVKPFLTVTESDNLLQTFRTISKLLDFTFLTIERLIEIHSSGFLNMAKVYKDAGIVNSTMNSRFNSPKPDLTTDEANSLTKVLTDIKKLLP